MNAIYITSVNETGTNQSVVESDGRTVWMYLHNLKEQRVVADSPICSLAPPIAQVDFKKTYSRGDPPPFIAEYSSPKALMPDFTTDRIVLRWSDDANSIVVLVDGEPFSMILAGQKTGFSKAISKEGYLGHPWSPEAYAKAFGEPVA